ncbi:MAG: hypothetical protein ACRD02_06045 [Acidimicrobiia bacterium]
MDKLKEEPGGRLVADERIDLTLTHPEGYHIAYTFQEGEEVPRGIAEQAGLLKPKKSRKTPEPPKDANLPSPRTAKYPAPITRAKKRAK